MEMENILRLVDKLVEVLVKQRKLIESKESFLKYKENSEFKGNLAYQNNDYDQEKRENDSYSYYAKRLNEIEKELAIYNDLYIVAKSSYLDAIKGMSAIDLRELDLRIKQKGQENPYIGDSSIYVLPYELGTLAYNPKRDNKYAMEFYEQLAFNLYVLSSPTVEHNEYYDRVKADIANTNNSSSKGV